MEHLNLKLIVLSFISINGFLLFEIKISSRKKIYFVPKLNFSQQTVAFVLRINNLFPWSIFDGGQVKKLNYFTENFHGLGAV